ncbi:3-ketoacyl-ACP reductase [Paenibacillus swuensis]|uniref:3-ketoacyl-ACP reductase n=1 Tax=Paenibacillus swuensis TaxID=1178515 RepID=A0A172TNH1_9BACL|nr:3-ketoacyl-ACP reductase [Paenibacillus swuensis]
MTALSLAEEGCNIIVNYVNSKTEAEELVSVLQGKGVQAAAVQADIASTEDRARLVEKSEALTGNIDILINNAGPFVRERRLFSDYTSAEINSLMQGNLLGVMELDLLMLQGMRKRGWGRLIHFGFGHAAEARGWPHRAVYAAAKVGLVSFTKTLAVEEAPFGITVNMICPGDIRGLNKEKTISEVSLLEDEESPRGRPGAGEDVARVISFLCQPDSDFITGNIVDVNGGLDPIRTHIK